MNTSSTQLSEPSVIHPHRLRSSLDGLNDVAVSSEVDELLRDLGMTEADLGDSDEGRSLEDCEVQTGFRTLWVENNELRDENTALRTELKDMQLRISDICAALTGESDAIERVHQRVLLEQRRDSLVKILTQDAYSNWQSYVNSLAKGLEPYAAGEALLSKAKIAIPYFEQQARIPKPVRTDSLWKSLATCTFGEYMRIKGAMDSVYSNRVREAQEAQHVLALLKDEDIWSLIRGK